MVNKTVLAHDLLATLALLLSQTEFILCVTLSHPGLKRKSDTKTLILRLVLKV